MRLVPFENAPEAGVRMQETLAWAAGALLVGCAAGALVLLKLCDWLLGIAFALEGQ